MSCLSSFSFPSNMIPFFFLNFSFFFFFPTIGVTNQLPPLSDAFCTFSLAFFIPLFLLQPNPAVTKFLGNLRGIFCFYGWLFSVWEGICLWYLSSAESASLFSCSYLSGIERIKPCVLGNGTPTWESFAQEISRLFIVIWSWFISRTITADLMGFMLGSTFTPWHFPEIL